MFSSPDSVSFTSVLPGIERRTLCHGARMLLAEFRLRAGSELPAHAHPHEQTGYLVSGRLRLRIGDETRELGPGDSWSIPGGVEHGASVLADAVAIEVFAPVREDYLPAPASGGATDTAAAILARALEMDAAELHDLQRLAFRSEAERYGDWNIPPLTEPLAATQRALAEQWVLKATLDGTIVGSVRGRTEGAICQVGRLVVHPRARRQGLGARLLTTLEAALPQVRRFQLFTGARSVENLRLYERLGYRRERTEIVSAAVELVHLAKER